MTVFGIIGNIGNGKTLKASYFAALFNAYGKKIFSNYNILLKNAKKIHAQDFANLNHLKNALAILDEAYEWLESRLSGTEVNRILSHGVLQSRKRGLDLIYTAQLNSTVDLRLRRITSTLIWALTPSDAGFNYVYFTPHETIYKTMSIELAQQIFKIYDTTEIVSAADMNEGEPEATESDDDKATRDRSTVMQPQNSMKTMRLLKQILITQKDEMKQLKDLYKENKMLQNRISELEIKVRKVA